MFRLVRAVPGALAALALLFGACGGDDESSPAVSGVDFPVDAPEPPATSSDSEDDSGDGSGGTDSGSGTDAGGAATGG